MSISRHDITATVQLPQPLDLSVIDANITLDDSWSPYAQASLTCYAPEDQTVIEQIDPRDNLRVQLDISKTYGGTAITHDPEVLYSFGWETEGDWVSFGSPSLYTERATWAKLSGSYGFYIDDVNGLPGGIQRTFTGLTPGRSYTLSAMLWSDSTTTVVTLGTSSVTMGTTGWVSIDETFTAENTTETVSLSVSSATGEHWYVQVDDFTMTQLSWVEPTEFWNISGTFTDQARTFNLILRERMVDHETGTMTLKLESDEALLQDSALVATAPDNAELAHKDSLRAITNSVLSKLGATLEADTMILKADAIPTNTWDTGSGWTKDTASGTLVYDSATKEMGTGSIDLGFPATGEASAASKSLGTLDLSGDSIRLWVRSADWSAASGVEIRFYNTAGVWDSPAAYFSLNLKTRFGLSLVNNEWVDLSIPRSAFTTVGAADWATIRNVQFWVYAAATGGVAGDVFFNYVRTYPSAAKGLVSIAFDDGWANGTPVGEPLMTAKGWMGSSFVIPTLLDTTDYTTQAHIDALAAKGWDISGHGATNLSTLTQTQRLAELDATATYLDDHGYKGRQLYAYPNGANNDAIRSDVAEHFMVGRTIDWANQPTGFTSPYRVNAYSVSNTTPLADLKALVDAAANNREWFIIVLHRLTDTPDQDITYSTSDFSALLDYIATKDVDVKPISEILLQAGPGQPDADFTAETTTTSNLLPNPAFRTGVGNWIGGATNSSLTRMTGLTDSPVAGVTTYSRTTFSGTGTGGAYSQGDTIAPLVNVVAGQQYTMSVWVRSSVEKPVRINMQWNGTSSTNGEPRTLVPNVWTKLQQTLIAPAGATTGGVYLYVVPPTTWNAGEYLDTTGWAMVSGSSASDFFDGSSSDAEYVYAWTGTDNNSISTKTDPGPLRWEPGVTDWDFLEPLVQKAGLRLFCDERRRWHLTSSTLVDGQINIAEGFNVTQASDTISRYKEWYDSVVIKYSWTDSDGASRIAYDSAGGPGTKALVLQYERPYPGPGAAQIVLDRALGRGRVLSLEAASDYSATPGMSLVATLPASPIQTGIISSVSWAFPDDRMTVGSRGLTDTPEKAWALAAGTWADQPTGTAWTEF